MSFSTQCSDTSFSWSSTKSLYLPKRGRPLRRRLGKYSRGNATSKALPVLDGPLDGNDRNLDAVIRDTVQSVGRWYLYANVFLIQEKAGHYMRRVVVRLSASSRIVGYRYVVRIARGYLRVVGARPSSVPSRLKVSASAWHRALRFLSVRRHSVVPSTARLLVDARECPVISRFNASLTAVERPTLTFVGPCVIAAASLEIVAFLRVLSKERSITAASLGRRARESNRSIRSIVGSRAWRENRYSRCIETSDRLGCSFPFSSLSTDDALSRPDVSSYVDDSRVSARSLVVRGRFSRTSKTATGAAISRSPKQSSSLWRKNNRNQYFGKRSFESSVRRKAETEAERTVSRHEI